jgi:hypothetical protein
VFGSPCKACAIENSFPAGFYPALIRVTGEKRFKASSRVEIRLLSNGLEQLLDSTCLKLNPDCTVDHKERPLWRNTKAAFKL